MGEKKEKKRNAIQPLCVIGWEETHWKRERERERAEVLCELHRVSKKHREIFSHLRCNPNEEIQRYTVRMWESEKEKVDIFLCSNYT